MFASKSRNNTFIQINAKRYPSTPKRSRLSKLTQRVRMIPRSQKMHKYAARLGIALLSLGSVVLGSHINVILLCTMPTLTIAAQEQDHDVEVEKLVTWMKLEKGSRSPKSYGCNCKKKDPEDCDIHHHTHFKKGSCHSCQQDYCVKCFSGRNKDPEIVKYDNIPGATEPIQICRKCLNAAKEIERDYDGCTKTVKQERFHTLRYGRHIPEFDEMDGVLITYPFRGMPLATLAKIVNDQDLNAYILLHSAQRKGCKEVLDEFEINENNIYPIYVDRCLAKHDIKGRMGNEISDISRQSNSTHTDYDVCKTHTRDFGPWFIEKDGKCYIADFNYHEPEWGNSKTERSNAINKVLSLEWGKPLIRTELFLEGGNMMVHKGNAVTTRKVYQKSEYHHRRPYGRSEEDIRHLFKNVYATDLKAYWDPTGLNINHIDTFAKILGPQKILIGSMPGKKALDSMANEFEDNGYEVYRVDISEQGFTNSLILNEYIYVPVIGEHGKLTESEKQAIKIYSDAMPGYTIVPVCSSYVWKEGKWTSLNNVPLSKFYVEEVARQKRTSDFKEGKQFNIYVWKRSDSFHCRTKEIPTCGAPSKAWKEANRGLWDPTIKPDYEKLCEMIDDFCSDHEGHREINTYLSNLHDHVQSKIQHDPSEL